MPLPFEEIALKDIVKHPKLIILYVALLAVGYVGKRFLPDDCQQESTRWQSLYYATARQKDSIQSSKDDLYEKFLFQRQIITHTDSVIKKLAKKSELILKTRNHEH